MDDITVVVINFHCLDMPVEGSPPSILANYLHSYFPDKGSLQLLNVQFDLGSARKIGAHKQDMDALASQLQVTAPDQILIFVTTHCGQNGGYLFAGKDSQGGRFFSASQVNFWLIVLECSFANQIIHSSFLTPSFPLQ